MYCSLSRKSELEKKLQENVGPERLCMATPALVYLGVAIGAFPASSFQGIKWLFHPFWTEATCND